MAYRLVFSIMLCCFCGGWAYGQDMTREIEKVIQGKRASVGVAVIHGDNVYTIANDRQYPTMSVFKLHIAVAALKKLEADNIPLDKMVHIGKSEILNNTYSPLRDRFPNQDIHISYRDMIDYTVRVSDNNTCDWLIRFVGGIDKVEAYAKSLGITGMRFTETEEDMHLDIMRCYNNWSTPLAIAQLLKKIYSENILTDEHFTFLETSLLNCVSGKNKLIAGLPKDVRFGHKTGHSDRRPDGVQISEGDAGVIYLPGGEKCYIVVLIMDSLETDDDNAGIMADICRIVYSHLNG